MNKGLEIRNNKLKRKAEKRSTVKKEQQGLVRFVNIEWDVIERVNGKYKHTGSAKGRGLQVQNKVFLTTGHFKYVNSKSVKITKIYDEIPDWATPALLERFQNSANCTSVAKCPHKNLLYRDTQL